MRDKSFRERLQRAAWMIGERNGTHYGPIVALRKLFIQERRKNGKKVGWKRGEIFEFLMNPSSEEWGDIGYYLAQSYTILWLIYYFITPERTLEDAITKFNKRANVGNVGER